MDLDLATLQPLLDWAARHQTWAAIIVFLISLGESLVIVGYIVPGAVLLFGIGTLIALGTLDIWSMLIWAAVGAAIGDGFSFWLGYHFQDRLRAMWPFRVRPQWLERGEGFFQRHGGKSVVIGRFVGPVRPIIPVVAGMLRMSPVKFVIIDVLASAGWAPAYILPGVIFGASLGLASEVATRLGVLLVALILFMIFTLWAAYRSYLFLQPRADSIIGWILTWGKSRRVLSDITTAVLDPRQPETGALTIVAVMLALFATGLLALGQYFGDHHLFIHVDKAVFTLLQELRTPWADKIMVTLMGLGDAAVLLFLGLAVLAWLAWRRYWITAVHWLAALAFAMVLSFVVGREPTPWTVEDITRQALQTLWTNGHVTQATVIYGFFAVLIAREVNVRYRWVPYALASVVVSAIAVARLYLGGNWLSQILIGMILGLFWVMILGIAYRRHVSKLLTLSGMQSVAVSALLIGCVWYIGAHQEQELKRYTPRHPQHFIETDSWWQRDWQLLPAFRIDLSGASSHPLTLQWTGGLEVFRKYLQSQGWHEPVPLTPVSSLQWLRINPPLKELPLLPQAHDGRHESLVLVHATRNPERELVLRLWSGDYRLQETRSRVWTGYVAYQKTEMPLPILTVPLTVRDFDGPLQEFKSYLRGLRWRSVRRSHGPEAESETAGSMRWNNEILLMRPKNKSEQHNP